MPLPVIAEGLFKGLSAIPYSYTILKVLPWLVLVTVLKIYFGGARNTTERVMHSKVIMITGGTSGIGASLAQSLASRGAQLILLTRHSPTDPFLVDYVDDLRRTTNNELIYAEQVDLSSLHSIRLFATKWVDNAPPRRLDMVVLCGHTMTPAWGTKSKTIDGLEEEWGVNYLANFHLLSILSPAIRTQPPDRDVRIIFSACSSYIGATLDLRDTHKLKWAGKRGYGRSKLALMVFASAFQKHLDVYQRPDKQPNNARVIIADPGYSRTPGTRRWLSGGSLLGLLVYVVCWPAWWLVLKSAEQGAQTLLWAAMEAELGTGAGGKMVKECRVLPASLRTEVGDEEVAKGLWEFSEKQIVELEKGGAVKRALAKKENEEREKLEKEKEEEAKSTVNGKTKQEASKASNTGQESKPSSRRSRKAKSGG